MIVNVSSEYKRIKALFSGVDDKQLELIDGAITEAARLRVELNRLSEIVAASGLIKINPNNPTMQKELPVSRMIVKVRANYLNYIAKLSGVLGRTIGEDDEDLKEFE